jgi:uncharacterized delta-60 repeat protein
VGFFLHQLKQGSSHVKPTRNNLLTSILFTGAGALLPFASQAQCTAGMPDAAFGPAGSGGYVQSAPILNVGGNGEGIATGADRSIYTHSSVGFDPANTQVTVALSKFRPSGVLDTTYGGFGLIYPPGTGQVFQMANDAAGNLLVVRSDSASSISVSRYSASGVLDATFGTGGVATANFTNPFPIIGIASAPDGSTFVSGSAQNGSYSQQPFVLKLTATGQPDPGFGSAGVSFVPLPAGLLLARSADVALLPSGQLIVAGRATLSGTQREFLVARLQSDGSLDSSFGVSGMTLVDFGNVLAQGRRIAIQPDGNIVVAGNIVDATISPPPSSIAMIRLLPNGQLDPAFGVAGKASFTYGFGILGFSVALQNNGKILVGSTQYLDAAQTQSVGAVVRFTAVGTLDVAFGGTGVATFVPPSWTYSSGDEVTYDAAGKIILHLGATNASGSANSEYLVRIDAGSGKNCH